MATRVSKRTAQNVRAKEEDYSVDEITTLLTATKGRRKKADVELPPDNTEANDAGNVGGNAPVKPKAGKARGRKRAQTVEPTVENGDTMQAKNKRKRAASAQKEVNGKGDAQEVPQKRMGRGKKGPITADDEGYENEAISVEIDVKNGVELMPKTNSRRGKKPGIETETKAVPVKATKGRGKKPVTTEETTIPNGNSKAAEVIEESELVKGRKLRAKTPVIIIKPLTTKAKKATKINEETAEEVVPTKPVATKRNNKKNESEQEKPVPKKRGGKKEAENQEEATKEVPVVETEQAKPVPRKRNNKKKDQESKEEKPVAKKRAGKTQAAETQEADIEVDVEELPEVTAKKSRNNKKLEPSAVANHVTADNQPEQKEVGKKSRKRAASRAKDENETPTSTKVLKNATATTYDKATFAIKKEHTLKISSWNVAGMRSWLKKDGLKFLEYEEPDIFCLQVNERI